MDALTQLILTPEYFCNRIFQVCDTVTYQTIDLEEAVLAILEDKPSFIEDNNFINNLYTTIINPTSSTRKTIKIVHLADPHLDIYYKAGTWADCGLNYCCRTATNSSVGTRLAGTFGDLKGRCDLPPVAYQGFLDYIRDTIKPDMVVLTGDNSPHDDLLTDYQEILDSTNTVVSMT